ncbi:MAG TPA: hypothetical protein VKR24_07325 [Candidatus Limnocylindrales bacterium]|nr:hypothetical protein [Candidatus Limnocylindrales bacterium]
MRGLGALACLAAVAVLAGCAGPALAPPAVSNVPSRSAVPAGSAPPVGSAAPGAPSGPTAGSSGGAASGGATATSGASAAPPLVPSSALPRLVLSVTGTYRKTGNGPYAGSTDDYTFKSTDLILQPEAGSKVGLHGRITLTEVERVGTGLGCHGTFTASYPIATTGTIGGDPGAPVYQIQIAVAHPPQDSIKLHCTTGVSTSTFAHAAYVAAWAGLLGPIDVPYLGGSFTLSASGAIPYFGLTAAAAFSARRG